MTNHATLSAQHYRDSTAHTVGTKEHPVPTVLIVVGTRPEVIKCKNLIRDLENSKEVRVIAASTGQQKDILPQIIAESHIEILPPANRYRYQRDASMPKRTAQSLDMIAKLIEREEVTATLVQGDTLSAYSGALASFLTHTRLIHLEAGVRSDDPWEPYPEEGLRRMISRMANEHVCLEQGAVQHLLEEQVPRRRIHLAQHPATSYLQEYFSTRSEVQTSDSVLVTFHRRERRAERLEKLTNTLLALRRIRPHTEIRIIRHPHVDLHALTDKIKDLTQLEPRSHTEFLNELAAAGCLLTDSAGTVEEATRLFVPTVSFRRAAENRSLGEGPIIKTEDEEAALSFLVDQLENRQHPRNLAERLSLSSVERQTAAECVISIVGKMI